MVAIAAALVSVGFLLFVVPRVPLPESPDYFVHYSPLAHSLLEGKGYRYASGEPAVVYPPGYSFILAGLFYLSGAVGVGEAAALGIFNVLCGIGIAILLLLIGKSLFGRRVALIGTLVWITYPLYVWLGRIPSTELPFMVLFFTAVFLVLRGIARKSSLELSSFATGVLIGVGSLIRPFAVLMSLPILPTLWHSTQGRSVGRRVIPCGLLLLGNLVAILPWEAWVYKESGMLILLATNGRTAILDGLMLDTRPDLPGQVLPIPEDVRAFLQDIGERSEELESPAAIGGFLLSELRSKPATVLKLLILKAARALYATDSQRRERPVALLQIPYYLLALLGASLAWRSGIHGRRFLGLLVPLVLYFWGMTIVVLSIVRYMLPVLGLLGILAGLSLSALMDRVFHRVGPSHPEEMRHG
ncbi:MAG: glycosyltransferase family 39 protein [Acidobacteria bacterium]|nr:glycosyltransferase family 39 protein [Acidobacteriota bacterium]